jgi:transcriptional regulator with XRE-family HTH domain
MSRSVRRVVGFGATVRRLRAARGLTQAALAGAAGTSRTQLVNLEAEGSLPSLDLLVGLADALGVTTDALLGRDHPDMEGALRRCEAHLSLLRHRAPVPWGDPGIGPAHEYDAVIGDARRVLYGPMSTQSGRVAIEQARLDELRARVVELETVLRECVQEIDEWQDRNPLYLSWSKPSALRVLGILNDGGPRSLAEVK